MDKVAFISLAQEAYAPKYKPFLCLAPNLQRPSIKPEAVHCILLRLTYISWNPS